MRSGAPLRRHSSARRRERHEHGSRVGRAPNWLDRARQNGTPNLRAACGEKFQCEGADSQFRMSRTRHSCEASRRCFNSRRRRGRANRRVCDQRRRCIGGHCLQGRRSKRDSDGLANFRGNQHSLARRLPARRRGDVGNRRGLRSLARIGVDRACRSRWFDGYHIRPHRRHRAAARLLSGVHAQDICGG